MNHRLCNIKSMLIIMDNLNSLEKIINHLKKESQKTNMYDVITHSKFILGSSFLIGSGDTYRVIWKKMWNPFLTVRMEFFQNPLHHLEYMNQIIMTDYFENDIIQFVEIELDNGDFIGVILPKIIDGSYSLFYGINSVPTIQPYQLYLIWKLKERKLLNIYFPKFTQISSDNSGVI